MDIPVNKEIYKIMLKCSLRYSIGRMTGVPSIIQSEILKQINLFEEFEIIQMIEEVVGYDNNLGHQCDIEDWNLFVQKLKEILESGRIKFRGSKIK